MNLLSLQSPMQMHRKADLKEYLLGAILGFSGLPNEKRLLTGTPWFMDGLTREEAAVLVPLTSTFQDVVNQDMTAPDLLPGLLESISYSPGPSHSH